MTVQLLVDGREIGLNEFVEKLLSGMVIGTVTSLHGVKADWTQIEIQVKRETSH